MYCIPSRMHSKLMHVLIDSSCSAHACWREGSWNSIGRPHSLRMARPAPCIVENAEWGRRKHFRMSRCCSVDVVSSMFRCFRVWRWNRRARDKLLRCAHAYMLIGACSPLLMSRCVRVDRCARQGSLSGALARGWSMRRDMRFVSSAIQWYSCVDVFRWMLRCSKVDGPCQRDWRFFLLNISPESSNSHQGSVTWSGVVLSKWR